MGGAAWSKAGGSGCRRVRRVPEEPSAPRPEVAEKVSLIHCIGDAQESGLGRGNSKCKGPEAGIPRTVAGTAKRPVRLKSDKGA